jgi:C4-type Zn-finger protein
MLRMNNIEGVLDYITRVQTVMNQLKRNGESISEQRVVEKFLRSLNDTFENMICAIEESKDLTKLAVDELDGSLLAHEQRKNLKKK